MKGKEFKKYLNDEIKEIAAYVVTHPELTKTEAEREWINKYAADFAENWEEED